MNMSIKCEWLEQAFIWNGSKDVQISIVGYEHPGGIPARFCAGLIPAVALSRQLAAHGVRSTVRVIDPSPIANYCNGWRINEPRFRNVLGGFLAEHGVSFFFDEAEPVTDGALEILKVVGRELESATDPAISGMIQRIKESGRRHGGEAGEGNAILYMAAHPFSWLDMYHPLVWKKKYIPGACQFANLMSKPESRFTLIREYLRGRMPDLNSGIVPSNHYMAICNVPCYIPLDGEPTITDLAEQGEEWCHGRYRELKGESGNHRRALKDFESLLSFSVITTSAMATT